MKAFQRIYSKLPRICWEPSTSWFICGFVFQVASKKNCVQTIWDIFLHENINKYNFYKFTTNSLLSFLTNQKQEPCFQQVGGLVTLNTFAFSFWRVGLYFKAMPNSIDFHKRSFFHQIDNNANLHVNLMGL